jgi:hypothetical protein
MTGFSPTLTQLEAAHEFVAATLKELQNEKGVHAETAVAAAARMAGTILLRSFGLPLAELEPGQALLSDKANEEGPRLLQLMLDALAAMGVEVDGGEIAKPIPPGHEPLVDLLETQRRLDPAFARIRERHGLSEKDTAESAAVAAAILIGKTAGVLAPGTAAAIAASGFVEGSKTVPAR